jgi:hypothetical protein
MRTIALAIVCCVLIFSAGFFTSASAAKLYVQAPAVGEVTISVDPALHQKFGLSYPVTYILSIPSGSSGLAAYKRYGAVATWVPLATRTSSDFFNGVEAVRFDYGANLAYVSVTFDSTSDDIYLRIVDGGGQPVNIAFQSISKYYDNRQAAVTFTADDWNQYSVTDFTTAANLLRSYNIPMTGGIITGQCLPSTWQSIQAQLDLGGIEAVSHSRTHVALPYPDPEGEIIGSRQDIITNLNLPLYFRKGSTEYVIPYIYAYGGAVVYDTLVTQAGYLVSRLAGGPFHDFSTWDSIWQKYQAIGITLEMGVAGSAISDLAQLNTAFDNSLTNGSIYHVMLHPNTLSATGEWGKGYIPGHLSHISNRTNVWYVNFGALYLYHLLQDNAAGTIEVLSGSPVITQQPAARTVSVGQTAVFSVTAIGTLPLSYQWQKSNVDIPGATSAGYITPATVPLDSGATFRCVITNAHGTVTSQSAVLRVTASLIVPNVLTNGDFEGGMSRWDFYSDGSATAAVSSPGASGSANAANIAVTTAGANVQLYQYGITLEPNTSYILSFDGYSNTGHDVDISLGQHVAPYTNYGLSEHHFDLTTSWQRFVVSFTTGGFADTVSDGRLMLFLGTYDVAGDQYYFDNIVLDKTSDLAPRIVTQPVGLTVASKLEATFTVVASGLTPFTYQWQRDSVDIAGATSASYTTPPASSADSGAYYRCRVTNSAGSTYSQNAQLLVLPARPPVIIVDPHDTTTYEGRRVQFKVTATGALPLLYHWQRNDQPIDFYDSVYTIASVTRADSGAMFRCWIANVDGRDTSAEARLIVLPAPPTITTQPSNQTVLVGSTATFSVVATGSATLMYQWQKNGAPISGANNTSYTTPATAAGDSGATFRCIVTNGGGADTSHNAVLNVNIPVVPSVVFSPASGSMTSGVHYAVNIVASNVAHLHSAHIAFGFDSSIVRADSILQGSFLAGSTTFSYTPNPLIAGTSTVTVDQAISGSNGVSGSGTLFTVHFTTLKVGVSLLTFNTVELRDTASQLITSTNTGGTVTVLPLRLGLTVFLEGPYDSTTLSMGNSLRTRGILSTKFPALAIPVSAVDSVNIEIRDSVSASVSTIRRFAPAWLLSNGSLRGFTDTTQTGVLFDAPAGSYNVVVRHRNHLAVMSRNSVALSGTAAQYDFSTGQDKTYGSNAMVRLGGGAFGLYAGHNDGDNIITVLEYNAVGLQMFQSGYLPGDHDMSGTVTVLDYNPVGLNMFKSSQVP